MSMKLTMRTLLQMVVVCSLLLIGYFFLLDTHKIDERLDKNTDLALIIQQTNTLPQPAKSQPQQAKIEENTFEVCRATFTNKDEKTAWQQSKRVYIKSLLTDLTNQGVEGAILDQVAVDSGIGLYRGRIFRADALATIDDSMKPPFYDGEAFRATTVEQNLVDLKLDTGDYDGLFKAIYDQVLRPNAFYLGKTDVSFLLGHILDRNLTDAEHVIGKLLDANIYVGYADLVSATTLNRSVNFINALFESSVLQADMTLKRFGQYRSLALIALESGNVELIHYWIAKGSPLQSDLFDDNALDMLTYYGAQFNQSDRDDLFASAIHQAIGTKWPTTVEQLKKIISPSLFNQHEDKLRRGAQGVIISAQAQSIIRKMYQNILDGRVSFDLSKQPAHLCFSELGRTLTELALETKPQDPVDAVPQLTKPVMSDTLISEAEDLFEDGQLVVAHLAKEQGLESKRLVDKYKRRKIALKSKARVKQIKSNPEQEKTQKIMLDMFALAKAGKWNEALALFDQLAIPKEKSIDLLLMIALETNTQFEIIKDLLDKGAKLMPNAISRMIVNNNVQLAERLLPYGLDIHYVEIDQSPLARSVQNHALKMLKFLIKQGVAMDSHSYNFDALDIALRQFNLQKNGMSYVTALINAGASVELSHKQIVSQMSVNNMEAFLKLTRHFPEFRLD